MARVSDLKDNKFMSKGDVTRPILVTIKSVEQINVAMESQPPEFKWCLHFLEHAKPMILNLTNGQTIEQIVGTDDMDRFVGHKIVVYFDPTIMFAGERKGGIRVRAPKKPPVAPPTALTPATPPPEVQQAINQGQPSPVPEEPQLAPGEDFDPTAGPEDGDVPF